MCMQPRGFPREGFAEAVTFAQVIVSSQAWFQPQTIMKRKRLWNEHLTFREDVAAATRPRCADLQRTGRTRGCTGVPPAVHVGCGPWPPGPTPDAGAWFPAALLLETSRAPLLTCCVGPVP